MRPLDTFETMVVVLFAVMLIFNFIANITTILLVHTGGTELNTFRVWLWSKIGIWSSAILLWTFYPLMAFFIIGLNRLSSRNSHLLWLQQILLVFLFMALTFTALDMFNDLYAFYLHQNIFYQALLARVYT